MNEFKRRRVIEELSDTGRGQHQRVIAGREVPLFKQPLFEIGIRLDAQKEHQGEDTLFTQDRGDHLVGLHALQAATLRFLLDY